ncbi:MAG: UDP-N-acetylmuramate dehydrogenase [Endomicrobium sp.]|jgi:UDP-N-acetylmuramate dehydrogenase|nr:UDP-N-acetylmuramate dehydrogenase [Endomicrobium sp.]
MEERGRIIKYHLTKMLLDLGCKIFKNEPLSKHCSFKIGGPADFFIKVSNKRALYLLLLILHKSKYFILGSGTNILFQDEGYRGVIISITGMLNKIYISEGKIISGAGALLSDIVNVALKNNLTNIECIIGIPGTVGGAVYGNSGFKNGCIGDIIYGIEIYRNLKKEFVNNERIEFSYRKTGLGNCVITNVIFMLQKKSGKNNLKTVIYKNMQKRLKSQPLSMPSAGSVFKNFNGISIGELIEKSGLKGLREGGAQISNIHGNFIVNTGNASSKDVLILINLIKKTIQKRFNINPILEIKIIK